MVLSFAVFSVIVTLYLANAESHLNQPCVSYVSSSLNRNSVVEGTLPSPGGNCTDLDTALDHLGTGITITLEQGTHWIRSSHQVDLHGVANIKLVGAGAALTVITCSDQNGLVFVGPTNLTLANFTISNCGLSGDNMLYHATLLNQVTDLWFSIPPRAKIALFLGLCTNVVVQDINITETAGLGFLGINILGKSSIQNSGFTNNIRPVCYNEKPPVIPSFTDSDINQIGGGAFILYTDISNPLNVKPEAKLWLSDLYFAHNADCTFTANTIINFPYFTNFQNLFLYNYTIGAGGGLSVILSNKDLPVSVDVYNSIFYQNEARYGAGAFIASFAGFQESLSVTFIGCTFSENGLSSTYNSSSNTHTHCNGGAGLAIFTDLLNPNHFRTGIPTSHVQFVFKIIDSEFIKNSAEVQGGGIFAYSLLKIPQQVSSVNDAKKSYLVVWDLLNITFSKNSATRGSAGYFNQISDFSFGGSVLLGLANITARENHNRILSSNQIRDISTLHLRSIVATLEDMTLEYNQGSALYLESALVSLHPGARLSFHGNTAYRGGALHLSGHSPMLILHENCLLHFEDNMAYMEGGAIYYSVPLLSSIVEPFNLEGCFLLTPPFLTTQPSEFFDIFNSGIKVSFRNNQAPIGGTIYGSTLQSCTWAQNLTSSSVENIFYRTLYRNYFNTFSFDKEPIDERSVSTLPASIRVTTGAKEPLAAYPGQAIPINIQVLDYYNNTVPDIVATAIKNVRRTNTKSSIRDSGFWYTDVLDTSFSVFGEENGLVSVSIFSSVNHISDVVSVNLSACPIGFKLNQSNLGCRCSDYFLNETRVSCDRNSISFQMLNRYWIGVDPTISDPTSEDLILSDCIFNYCKDGNRNGNRTVVPDQLNSQCNFNRIGILCGSCNIEEGYSSVLGSYECHKCSNNMLSLIIVFAVAGALLFSGIFFLDITIDKGWTNSVMFFCSIVSNFEYLIENRNYNYGFLPARLLNLQIGVSVCFYDGMTALNRTGIQLAFPVYLFLLMIVFAILCRRYSWMSTHFSPARTLMTLSVICYTSILTTSMELVGFVRLETFRNMGTSYRWYNDPNQVYFQGLHGFLSAIGIAIIVVYIVPFPLFLLLPNLAYRYLVKLTPLFDALWDAYKPRYRFWLGLRLISVAFLFACTRLPANYGIVFSGIYGVLFFQIQGALLPFKDKVTNWAESFFFAIVLLFYWGNLCLILFTFTYRDLIISAVVIGLLTCSSYLVIFILFILHLHHKFPYLCQKLCYFLSKTMRKKEMAQIENQTDISSSYVHVLDLPLHVFDQPQRRSDLCFRESLLNTS